MWSDESKLCEVNCQCSDLLPSTFHIHSGSGGTKRKQEASTTLNYKLKMNPHSIDFSKSPLSPIHTPKRRILGELQNFQTENFKSYTENFKTENFKSIENQIFNSSDNQSYIQTCLQENFKKTSFNEEFQSLKHTSSYIEERQFKNSTFTSENQNFKSPPLREIQNFKNSTFKSDFKPTSPYIERLKYSPEFTKSPKSSYCPLKSPVYSKSPLKTSQKENVPNSQISYKSPILGSNSPHFGTKSPILGSKNSPLTSIQSPILNSPIIGNIGKNSPAIGNGTPKLGSGTPKLGSGTPKLGNGTPKLGSGTPKLGSGTPKLGKNSPLISSIANNSPVTTKLKRTSKITRIFEERTKFKMDNKENLINETFMKFDFEEETRDCSFSGSFQKKTWTSAKLDFTDTIPPKFEPYTVPEKSEDLDDLESLQDLEAEFDNETFDQCTKYEIISTDSPDIISRGRSNTRKVSSKTFDFGAPISENEASTSFNRPATRMLNFDDEDFEFTSPAVRKTVSVKKSLKFNDTPSNLTQMCLKFNESQTPTKSQKTRLNETPSDAMKFNETPSKLLQKTLKFNETPTKLTHQRSDASISSIGSMVSPASSRLRLFPSESTTSMESGFISEFEEPFLDIEESNSPKVANFNDLLSGQIKENILTDRNFVKRPTISRSLSFHPESKAKVSLLSILESPEEKKSQKRTDREMSEENCCKKRKSNCDSPVQRRPVLQRAFSENNASIMSALARSALEPDLIGDFTQPFSLPLTVGNHSDLKSISCDTLAGLLRGDYNDSINNFQVIDCRYPYEFEGGHVTGAVNLYTPTQVSALVSQPSRGKVLIFHCEFSIERGPKLSRFLRSSDREKNKENYPQLYYPEMYLLHEGYRSFYNKYPQFCSPSGYTTMLDPKHKDSLRKHRSNQNLSSSSASGRRNRLLL